MFVSIAVVGFHRGGWYVLLGLLFGAALVGIVAYASWGIAVLGGDQGRRWLGNNHALMTALRLISLKRGDSPTP